MNSLKYKYLNFTKAIYRLQEVCALYDGSDAIMRDSLIQRFEFTYELSYKTLHEYFQYMGIFVENGFPRTIFKQAYANGIISDEKLWLQLLEDRNTTSHLYNENFAIKIASNVKAGYVTAFSELADKMGQSIPG